ncbi:sporulation phosphorelay system protein KapB [Bacillus sp. FJAT-45350]|uniref:sporulation phosphorelay system protein KapB n=1 Tax=Bacillus sp. FJAT-45350 TaxID=2011014 RepID=UPI000BB71AD1|nr:sporulation phosphorelay system protein KapB [Bacillus sp. FJAT-45350]
MSEKFEVGQIVTGIYKTGKYIGEITMERPEQYVMKVLAVLKHPEQGDLHNPKQGNAEMFHERRALAYTEHVNVPKTHIKRYEEDVPTYKDSLRVALEEKYKSLENDDSQFAKRSLELLRGLEADYFK